MKHFDFIIIGTGMGGGTLVYALRNSGAKVLLLERGDFCRWSRKSNCLCMLFQAFFLQSLIEVRKGFKHFDFMTYPLIEINYESIFVRNLI